MMDPRPSTQSDDTIELALGHLLRAGVLLAASVVLAGGIVFLARHHGASAGYGTFNGEPEDLRSIRGILAGTARGHGRSVIQLGVLLLVATPIARVVFSAAAFAKQRDWLYVGLTAIVLCLLLFSLVRG
jgi:uncharacterized membrane protein